MRFVGMIRIGQTLTTCVRVASRDVHDNGTLSVRMDCRLTDVHGVVKVTAETGALMSVTSAA